MKQYDSCNKPIRDMRSNILICENTLNGTEGVSCVPSLVSSCKYTKLLYGKYDRCSPFG